MPTEKHRIQTLLPPEVYDRVMAMVEKNGHTSSAVTARLVELGLCYADEQSGAVDKADPLVLNSTGRGTLRKTSFLTDMYFMREVPDTCDRLKDSMDRLMDPIEGLPNNVRRDMLFSTMAVSALLNRVRKGIEELAGIVDAKDLRDEIVNGDE